MAEPIPFVPESPTVKWRRRLLWCLALMVLVITGYWGADRYRVWRYQHLLEFAQEAAGRSDWEGVEFSLRQAMQVHPGIIEPYERMAEYAEKLEPAQVTYWRRAVAQREPQYLRHRIRWAESAIARADYAQAAEALKGLDATSLETLPVKLVQAKLAAAVGDVAAATKAAGEAVKLDPGNATNRFLLARFQMLSTNDAVAETARAQIESYVGKPGFTPEARRILGMLALQKGDATTARLHLEAVLREPEAGIADQLRFLDLLRLEKAPDLEARLAATRAAAGTNIAAVLGVSQWMTSRGYGNQTVDWIKGLPPELASNPLLRAARLEGYLGVRQGQECAAWLGTENWGPDDHLRLALLARVHHGMGQTNLADTAWNAAVEKGRHTPRGRRALWQAATESGWRDKALAMLELSAGAPTDRRWALTLLFDHYSRIPDTTNMLAVSRRMLAVNPEDTMIRNNVAALSLLLKQDMEKGHRLAQLAWAERTKDPAVLATYGYSLLLQGKAEQALDMFERIPPQYAAHPSIAVYYAAVLAANGEMKKAQPYIKVASAGNILPEERELLADTIRQSALFTE